MLSEQKERATVSSASERPAADKKPYHAPALEEFGDLKSLTRADSPIAAAPDGGTAGYVYSGTVGT
jgi:hypothetical protein